MEGVDGGVLRDPIVSEGPGGASGSGTTERDRTSSKFTGGVPRLLGAAGCWKSGKSLLGGDGRSVTRTSFGGLTKEKRGTYPETGSVKNKGIPL